MSVFDDGESADNTTQANSHPNQHTPKTYEDYQQLRKAAPSKYYSHKMQQQMMIDAQTLGKAEFFKKSKSGNWWDT